MCQSQQHSIDVHAAIVVTGELIGAAALGFIVMSVPVAMLGYQITIPFLALGASAILGSTLVTYLFEKARRLSAQEA